MTPEGPDEVDDQGNRAGRDFEALVDEETLFPSTPPTKPPAAPASPAAEAGEAAPEDGAGTTPVREDAPNVGGGAAVAADDGRLARLEERVRETMDRLSDVVEAQLPGAVDGLRTDLETLRLELQTTLEQATQQLADERTQLRSQIATTVGAANRWFVRTRDQLYERLDHLAQVARDSGAQAVTAAPPALEAGPEPPRALAPAPSPPGEDIGEDIGEDVGEVGEHMGEDVAENDLAVEFEVVGRRTSERAARAEGGAASVGAAVEPVRRDLQQLQTEVAELRATVDRLEKRMARSKPVKLDPSQIELIVEAVVLAWPSVAPSRSRSGTSHATADGEEAVRARSRKAASPVKGRTASTAGTAAAKAGTASTAGKAAKALKAPKAAKRARKEPAAASPARRPYRSVV